MARSGMATGCQGPRTPSSDPNFFNPQHQQGSVHRLGAQLSRWTRGQRGKAALPSLVTAAGAFPKDGKRRGGRGNGRIWKES